MGLLRVLLSLCVEPKCEVPTDYNEREGSSNYCFILLLQAIPIDLP